MADTCPTNSSGEHRYFIFKTYETFEPILSEATIKTGNTPVYEKVEYAVLGCNCSSVIKRRITDNG